MSNLNFSNLRIKVSNLDGRVTSLESQVPATSTSLANHISSTSGAHTANAIVVTPISNFVSTDVQASIEELLLKINNHITSIAAHTANSIVTDDLTTLQGSDVQTLLGQLEELEITNFNATQSRIDALSADQIAAAPPVGRSFTNVQTGINVLDSDIVSLKDQTADHETLINQMLTALLNTSNNNAELLAAINNLITGQTSFSAIILPLSAPGSPHTGSAYFSPSDNKLYIYNGTWKSVQLV